MAEITSVLRRRSHTSLLLTSVLAFLLMAGIGVADATTTPLAGAIHGYDAVGPNAQRARATSESSIAPVNFFAAKSGLVAEDGTTISGITGHGIDRVIGDGAKRAGVKPQALLDAIKNPTKITEGVDDLGRPFKVYTGRDARIVVNPKTGRIVSVNPRSGAGTNR